MLAQRGVAHNNVVITDDGCAAVASLGNVIAFGLLICVR